MRTFWLVLLVGCGTPQISMDAAMDAAGETAAEDGALMNETAAMETGRESSTDAASDSHELFDGPYGGEPAPAGRCFNEQWRNTDGTNTGQHMPPVSFRRCNAAGTYYPFHGREFCDARVTVLLAFDQTNANVMNAVFPELKARVVDAYPSSVRVMVVSVSPVNTRPEPTVFECTQWMQRWSIREDVAFVDENGSLRAFAPPMTLLTPLAVVVDRAGVIRWVQIRGFAADAVRREIDAVLAR